ncbi:MAG: hypothetical protein GDA46_05610 [Bdellovibrionales bacterium]|nr:hypothetical protein [Bdellovibrionales bacterium]
MSFFFFKILKKIILNQTQFIFLMSFLGILISCQNSSRKTKAYVDISKETDTYHDNHQDTYNNTNYKGPYDDSRYANHYNNGCKGHENSSRFNSLRSSTQLLSVTGTLDYVDSINVGNYRLRGRCSNRGENVLFTVNGYELSENPICSKNTWELELDLTAVASSENDIIIQISHSGERLCRTLKVAFTGPENYIPVPYTEDQYENSFYVMKYEAKVLGKGEASAKAVSKSEDVPISRISYDEAVKLCQNNGVRYDLIRNSQWQNIALSIEETDINWSSGRRSSFPDNALNCGVTRSLAKAASSDDKQDCADSSCGSGWSYKRRTHILTNGQVIWDMCGNVGEIMKDKYTLNQSFEGSAFELRGRLKDMFGPERTYIRNTNEDTRRRDELNWGLGEIDIEKNHNLIIRGLNYRTRQGNGIFSTEITTDQDTTRGLRSQYGFRCVYIP